MSSRPKAQRFIAAMTRIAEREGLQGPEAPLEWALSEIEAGVPVAQLWKGVQEEAKETSTRTWAYTVLYSLAQDARARVREARKIGAVALVDEALEIADRPASTAAEAASNRLGVDTRLRLAGMFNREEWGHSDAKVEIGINLGEMHLNALRRRMVATAEIPQLSDGPDYETLPSGE